MVRLVKVANQKKYYTTTIVKYVSKTYVHHQQTSGREDC